jgi:hypothetical protein
MKAKWLTGAIVTAGMGLLAPALAQAPKGGTPVSIDDIPPAAQDTIRKQAKNYPIRKLTENEAPNGGTYYEATYKALAGGLTTVDVSTDGQVLGKYRFENQPTGTGP